MQVFTIKKTGDVTHFPLKPLPSPLVRVAEMTLDLSTPFSERELKRLSSPFPSVPFFRAGQRKPSHYKTTVFVAPTVGTPFADLIPLLAVTCTAALLGADSVMVAVIDFGL